MAHIDKKNITQKPCAEKFFLEELFTELVPSTNLIVVTAVLILIFIPFAIIHLFKRRKSNKYKSAGTIFIIYLLISVVGFGMLVSPPTILKPNYSQPFDYNREVLKSRNIVESERLHSMLVSLGMNDPLGLIFTDWPENKNIFRKMWVEKRDDFYKLHVGNMSFPTLLQVPSFWLRKINFLINKFEEFLEIPQENQSRVEINGRVIVNSFEKMILVDVKIYEEYGNGMVLIAFEYDNDTSFADFISVVYTTNDYSRDKVSTVYLEAVYIPAYTNIMEFLLLIIPTLSLIIAIFFPLGIIVKKEEANTID